jgi:hypothetical protein
MPQGSASLLILGVGCPCRPFVHDGEKHLEMRTRVHIVLVEVYPAPQLAVHMRQPRRCLRGCLPRVTRTPSRVQATARSNTRTLRRHPPGLTRVESACHVLLLLDVAPMVSR